MTKPGNVSDLTHPLSRREAIQTIRQIIAESPRNTGAKKILRRYPTELNSLGNPALPVKLSRSFE